LFLFIIIYQQSPHRLKVFAKCPFTSQRKFSYPQEIYTTHATSSWKSYTMMDCLKPLRSSCSSEKSLKIFLNYYFVLICLQWPVNPSLPICPCLYPHFKEHKHTLITFLYCQYTLPDACMLYNCHHHAGDEEHVQMPRSLSTSLSLNFPRKMAATFSRILTTATLKFNDPFIALMRLPCFHQNSFKCACKWLMQDYMK